MAETNERHERNHKHEKEEKNPWMYMTALLAVLLVISMFFNFQMVGNVNKLIAGGAVQQPTQQTEEQAQPEQQAPTVTKTDKPKVELFVMSYCPYGLQMEKAYVPVAKLLGGKADMQMKWVSYAMHGLTEVEENTIQYCIQKEQPTKYLDYLTCFVASTNTTSCQQKAGIDKAKLDACYAAADKQFGIMANYNNQTSWLSGRYPQYNVHKTENQAYSVQGSPTMVINGKQVSVARSAEAVKQAICAAFNNPPAECNTQLSTAQEAAGAGAIGAGAANDSGAAAGCG